MLVGLKEILKDGQDRGIAIGSFNTPNLECLIAVIEAAEELNVPVIIAHAQCHEDIAPLDIIGPVMVELAKRSKVKVCVHLDHGEDEEYCKRAIALGFTSVMIDLSTLEYEDNVKGTKNITDYAHKMGVDVEAELGALPEREGGQPQNTTHSPSDLYTKPEMVHDFVAKTNIDALAIAFGTAHGIYKQKPVLNMDIITAVKSLCDVPLVMHGGSGVSEEEYREVIKRGIAKINYYSYMAYAGYAEAKAVVSEKDADFFHNLAIRVKDAMKENVIGAMKVFAGII